MTPERCDFCSEAQGIGSRVVYDDGSLVVLSARFQRPNNLGQMIVVPKRHICDLHAATDNEARDVFSLVRLTSAAILNVTGATGTTIRQNSGPPGQEVFHLHVHIFPRFEGDGFLVAREEETANHRVEHLAAAVEGLLAQRADSSA